jgi:tetratricopeptide (TPR) repeat protein
MRRLFVLCCIGLLGAGIVDSLVAAPSPSAAHSAIIVDYPSEGSIFPPDIIPPLFQWRDSSATATVWKVEVRFGERAPHIELWSGGEKMDVGELDNTLVGYVPPTLIPEQAEAHTWRPNEKVWSTIKNHSIRQPATVVISGYTSRNANEPVSSGLVEIQTSTDPVGAPILYRDVPLLPVSKEQIERGVIKPLPDSVLPDIKWELRYISAPKSNVVMQALPTCANCHSVSRDGKTLGIDVDGPQNDKGLYALLPVHKVSTISTDYIVRWSAFSDPDKTAQKRFGFMSQISPDGKYVITSVDVPGAHGRRIADRLYNGSFTFYGFGQVFFPTRGVLAWYSRESRTLQPLPGADDPDYVQTSAFWSPDGKYLVFSRAKARDPFAPAQAPAKYANDPNETQMQYDLYRIPFNDGKGGKAERVVGASENGMSNNFPKVSPDAKWIVFVRNKNGLLMRPDSQLYIVPFEGGVERRLNCNLKIMNSWHSFSPNGRWIVFSSKWPSYYTHMYLTHIDENGNDSPAILVENATAANRAVNIPEFVNIPPGGLERIEAPATDFYKLFDNAVAFSEKKQYDSAVPAWQKALALDPDDPRAHDNLGVALAETSKLDEAIAEYRKSLELNPGSSHTHNNLGSALAEKGMLDEAFGHFAKAVELNPDNASAQINLGNALALKKEQRSEALIHLRRGVELDPDSASGQNDLGIALARDGRLDESIEHIQRAVALAPDAPDYRYNLGRVLAAKGDFTSALPQFEQAAKLSRTPQPAILQMLAAMYSENGRYAEAVATARRALEFANQQGDLALESSLQANLQHYEAQSKRAGIPDEKQDPNHTQRAPANTPQAP